MIPLSEYIVCAKFVQTKYHISSSLCTKNINNQLLASIENLFYKNVYEILLF